MLHSQVEVEPVTHAACDCGAVKATCFNTNDI